MPPIYRHTMPAMRYWKTSFHWQRSALLCSLLLCQYLTNARDSLGDWVCLSHLSIQIFCGYPGVI